MSTREFKSVLLELLKYCKKTVINFALAGASARDNSNRSEREALTGLADKAKFVSRSND